MGWGGLGRWGYWLGGAVGRLVWVGGLWVDRLGRGRG